MPLSRPGASQVPGVNAVYSCPCPGGVRLSPPSAACGGKAYLFIWYFIWGGLFTEMKKRLFALFLCLCMVMTLLPVGAFAEGTEAQSGLAAGGASVTSVNPVETPDTHITFKFYNGETLLDTQVVNGNGQLTAPATPAIEGGRKFLGWYAVDATGQLEAQEFDFSNAYTNYSSRSEVKVMAKFEAVFYVYFMTVDGQVHSTAIANAANDFKVALPTDYEPNGKVVTGWVVGNDAVFTADTVVTADTYVYPVTEDCYWVTFNTTGGSMVASRSIKKGEALNLSTVTVPYRTGYSFKGWSTTADGANVVTSIAPTADTTLYAVWEGDDVKYMVVYWGENADDTNYSALATATLTGKVGSTVTLNATTGALPNSVSDRQHFKFSSSDSATIRADGSSVLNVYFSRNSYKLTFREYTGGFFSGSYHTVATITAKYNASIFAEFGKHPFNTTYNGRAWECTDSNKYNYALQTLDRMPGFDATFNLYDKSSNKLKTIYYYVQNVGTTVNSNRWPTSTANFSLYKEVQTYFNYATYDEEYHNIDGFNRYSASVAGFYRNQKDFSNNTLYLYYMRKSYTLTFNNYGAVSDNTVEYEAKLDSYNNYVPARPEGFSENAVFMGWYEVEPSQITSTTQHFDFTGKTMPADNLTLFAYWVEKPVTLTVQVPTLGGYTASNYEVAIGTVISGVDVFKDAEAKIAEAGRTVLKWVYEDGTAVDVNSAIGSDTTVKAVLEGEVYTLTYVTGTDAAITDENRYEYEALAQVKDGSGLKSGDKVFAYWTDETGKVYYPGSYVTMTGNKTLTANYVDPSVKVTLTYHSNFDADQTKTIDAVPNNDKVTVMDYTSTGLPSRLGYQVKGWKDANGVEYAVGSEARLDNNGSNDLYAVWEAIDVNYKVEFYYQNTDGTYPDKAKDENIVTRQGKTDSTVSVTAADKADKDNGKYVYDTAASNIESGTVAADGSLVLKLYFKLNQSSYTVRYLWNGTKDKVADDKVVADQTVGQTITEDPITVGGYTAVSTDSQSITLVPDSSSNVITFYYYKNVELTANSATHEYNGFEQSVEGFTGAPEDAGFSAITVGAAGTDVGEYPAKFAEGTVGTKDSTGKYIVVKATDGMLKITPKSNVITITANSNSKAYDGTALTDSGYSFTQGILLRGDVLHVSVKGSQTNFGSSANVVESYQVMRDDGTDVTGNYTFATPVNGTLRVTKREITLTSADGSKQYDGTPLTNHNVTVSGKGFADGEGATYTVTGSQTLAGSSANTFSYTLNEGTNPDNYNITTNPGTLTVTAVSDKVVVTIKEHSGTAKYDGSEKTVTGYDTEISNPLYTTDDFHFTGDATITGTDAGSYDMELVPENFENISNNFSNVEFVIEDGTLTISKREVTLTSATDSKMYNGIPLTNHNVTVSGDGFVDGEGASYTFTGSQTDKGSSKNWFTYTLTEGTKADNYTITQEYGELVVTKNTSVINITAKSANKTYDGQALTEPRYDFTQNILAEGDVLTAVVEGSQTDAGSSANVVKSYRVMRGGVDVTDFYTFGEIENGTLTVTERKVTLTSKSADKPYDGTPLTRPDVTVSDEGFVDGEVSDIKAIGTITDKGSVPNTITFTEGENFKASNYIIVRETGTLTITADATEVVVYISGNTGTEKYDGTEKTVTGYKVTSISSGLYKESDFAFTGNATISATDARATSYPMGLTAGNFENKNDNFSKVTFVVTDGSLTIDPRTVTLTSESATKEYDGTPLTRPDVTVSGDGFVEGEVSGIKATGSIIYYGEVDNDIKYTKEAGYKDSNYIVIVTSEIGKLGITRNSKELKVVANSGTWEYDGKFHADGGYTVTFGEESYTVAAGESAKLSTGDTVTAIITKQVKNVADSADGNNAIVTLTIDNEAQYANVSQANGTLTITAKPLTITADSAEKVYDGQPLTKNSFTNTELAEGDKLTATVTGSQTNVGSSDNVSSAAVIMAGEENVTANYTITYEKGSLTVTPVTDEVIVTVTERGGDYLYDGGEKVVTGYDAVSSNPLYTANDYSFSGDATVKSTNAGSYDMELAPEDFKNTSANFTNVTFIIVDGKLNIAQRKVLMTSADGEKVYDGTPLTNSTVTVTGDGFAEGEGAAYTVTGSQLDEGSSNNSFTYELNEGTLAANYIIETKEGELTVKPILTEITITANSGEKMYDGSALINGGYTFTSGILVDGDVLTAVVEGSQLNAGSSANVVKSYRVMRGETDVTANYRFAESVDGKLTVTARKVVMTSADDEKVYDGTPLTNDEITVTGDGFIEGEGVTYDVTGSQLDVGSSDNSFTYELNEGTLAENYIIETEEGKLTVTSPEQHIVITANSAEKTYDGTPLTDDGFTYTDFVLAEGDVLEAVVEGSQTDAGSSVNVIKSYRVMRGDEDVTANYIFDDSVDGTLTVTKRKVTLTSGTACKIYDGKYLTCNKVEVGGDGFVEGEGATYDVTGKRKDIGWSYNDFTYKLNDNTKADNYEITVERGFLYVKDQAEKPKTGDSSDLLLLLALMSMSGAGAAGTVYLYRRKREEQE